jgi:hypothetical protein
MRAVVVRASVLAFAASSLFASRPVRACGGCFSPPAPTQVTVVTGHRMAFSISPTQSVLWDQIQYSGSPQDFAWVLPVKAGAKIELSHDEFFAALDAMTNPVITGPTSGSCGGGGGFACGGASSASGLAEDSPAGGSVQVISQGVVGPYDTVTLHATDPNALYAWLQVNSYDIPASTRPVIDGYVSEGFDFIALRLAPGQGVQAMKPVRVVTPGAGLSLPLRMVAAGVGANVGITLYVIGDGRYEAQNFPNGVVDETKLVWLHAPNESNYTTLAQQVMQSSGGRTWLTEYALPTSLAGSPAAGLYGGNYSCGSLGPGPGSGVQIYGPPQSLGNLYYGECYCAGPVMCPQAIHADLDASLDALLEGAADAPDDTAADAAIESAVPEGAAPDASGDDASTSPEAGVDDAGGPIGPDSGCSSNPCDGFDDLQLASMGLDPNNTWVTRMRAILPSSALTEGDLGLQAASSQTPVSNRHTAAVYDDPSYNPCPQQSGGCVAADGNAANTDRALVGGALAFLGVALVRRRRSRSRA